MMSSTGSFIGFSAWKKLSQTYSVGNTIPFEGEIIDVGNGFDGQEFTCPITGVYYASVTFQRHSSTSSSYGMALDVVKASFVFLRTQDTYSNNVYGYYSNSGMIRCYSGETIKVQANGSGYIVGNTATPISTFSVMLMYEL